MAQLDRHEGGTVALQARVVHVARALVDAGLAAVLGCDRHDRQAVGFNAAIATPLADGFIDIDPLGWGLQDSPLALPAFFRRALLIEDDDADPLDLLHLQHHPVVVALGLHPNLLADLGSGIAAHILRYDHHLCDPFTDQLVGQVHGGKLAHHRLTAGHGRRRVV